MKFSSYGNRCVRCKRSVVVAESSLFLVLPNFLGALRICRDCSSSRRGAYPVLWIIEDRLRLGLSVIIFVVSTVCVGTMLAGIAALPGLLIIRAHPTAAPLVWALYAAVCAIYALACRPWRKKHPSD